jgi:hypothetical protein
MQTFLPYPDFGASAKCLDDRRLGKQRVEVLQLLHCFDHDVRWKTHPCFGMWKYNRNALCDYGVQICKEWIHRGRRDNVLDQIVEYYLDEPTENPSWLGNTAFHAAHRSNLLRKDPNFYGVFGWTEPPILPYIWPPGTPPTLSITDLLSVMDVTKEEAALILARYQNLHGSKWERLQIILDKECAE